MLYKAAGGNSKQTENNYMCVVFNFVATKTTDFKDAAYMHAFKAITWARKLLHQLLKVAINVEVVVIQI